MIFSSRFTPCFHPAARYGRVGPAAAIRSWRDTACVLLRLTPPLLATVLHLSCAMMDESMPSGAGEVFFTRVNIRYVNPAKVPSTNYLRGELLPAGSRVRVHDRQNRRIRFTAAGRDFRLIHVPKHTPGSLDDWFRRLFVKEDPWAPGAVFDQMDPAFVEAVEEGRLLGGMPREIVLMSYGYPPAHRTPSLEADVWTYWTARGRTELVFRDGRLLQADGETLPQTVRLFAVSDPSGAVIELDGRLMGRTPCMLSIAVDPEKGDALRSFRAVPARPDTPRLGVLASEPVAGASVGATIMVRNVLPLSAAHRMGLRPGDRIVSINGALVRSAEECAEIVAAAGFGAELSVQVERRGADATLTATLETPAQGVFHAVEETHSNARLLELRDQILFFDLKRKPVASTETPDPARKLSDFDPETETEPPPATATPSVEPLKILGSGFVVASGGYVLTSAALVADQPHLVVRTTDGREYAARVARSDVGNDWALLQVPELKREAIPLGRESALRKGVRIHCAGFAMQPTTRLARPVVEMRTGAMLDLVGLSNDPRHMQLGLPIGGGYSGSPVLDESGAWVGLVSDSLDGIIHAVAPPGTALPGTKFVLKAGLIEPLLPAAVRDGLARVGDARSAVGTEQILQNVADSIVMIRAAEGSQP